MAVTNGETVRVHYRGTFEDGEEFDSSAGRDPLEFEMGAGQVIPGFEEAVRALAVGEKITVTIPADDAYGPKHEALVQRVSAADFAEEPFVGGQVNLVSPEGDKLPGEIVAIEDGQVLLDFNHPLAGRALVFELELVEVIAP